MAQQLVQRRWKLIIAVGLAFLSVGLIGLTIGRVLAQPRTPEALSSEGFVLDEADEPALNVPFDGLEPSPVPENSTADPVQPDIVVVYVSGAVALPDTYQLTADARVGDVVQLAGGLTDSAARDQINLAERIHDAQHIHIPHIDETVSFSADGKQPAEQNGLINLNTASANELEQLDHIGEVLAQRIIEWRVKEGSFSSTEDIQQVKGITPSIYDAIEDDITVQ